MELPGVVDWAVMAVQELSCVPLLVVAQSPAWMEEFCSR